MIATAAANPSRGLLRNRDDAYCIFTRDLMHVTAGILAQFRKVIGTHPRASVTSLQCFNGHRRVPPHYRSAAPLLCRGGCWWVVAGLKGTVLVLDAHVLFRFEDDAATLDATAMASSPQSSVLLAP